MRLATVSSSPLARETWKRFGGWYGVDAIQRKFGDIKPPADWCSAIDVIGSQRIDLVLSQVKTKYPTFLPSLPEFEALGREHCRPVMIGPSPQQRLSIAAVGRCSAKQLRLPWTYLSRGCPDRNSTDFEVIGVEIPAADGIPGMRIMLEDLELDQ